VPLELVDVLPLLLKLLLDGKEPDDICECLSQSMGGIAYFSFSSCRMYNSSAAASRLVNASLA